MQKHLMQVFSHLNKGFLQASAHNHEGGFFVFLSSKITSPRFKEVLCILFAGIQPFSVFVLILSQLVDLPCQPKDLLWFILLR